MIEGGLLAKDFKSFLIFLIVFLILSITPCSATIIKNGNSSPSKPINEDNANHTDLYLNGVNEDLKLLNSTAGSLNDNLNYIKKRLGDFGWKFWKWFGIAKDILKTLPKLNEDRDKCNKITTNLESHTSLLEEEFRNEKLSVDDSDSCINNVNNSFCQKDAKNMANELSKTLNSPFSVKNVNASNLREGDIVQYLSEGKYPRYLTVKKVEIFNGTANNRNLLGSTPVYMLTGCLECTGDKLVEIPLIGEAICLNRPDNIPVYDTLNTAVGIQQKDIDKKKANGEWYMKTGREARTDSLTLYGITVTILFVAMVAAGVALCFGAITPPAWVAEGVVLVSLALLLGWNAVICVIWFIADRYEKKGHNLLLDAKSAQADLNTYTLVEDKPNIPMNVTTFDGIPVIKQPPISDWKNLIFVRMDDPKHGDLLPGPGLQFLYGPYDGYTGPDQFKFQYADVYGRVKGTVTVNVVVDPIPVFNIPTFNRTLRGAAA
jgi:hypothetical protein